SEASFGVWLHPVFGLPFAPHCVALGDAVQSKCPPITTVPWYQVMAWLEPDVSVLNRWVPVWRSKAPVQSEPPAARYTVGAPVVGNACTSTLIPNEPLSAVPMLPGDQFTQLPVAASSSTTAFTFRVPFASVRLSHWHAITIVRPQIAMSRTCGGVSWARSAAFTMTVGAV